MTERARASEAGSIERSDVGRRAFLQWAGATVVGAGWLPRLALGAEGASQAASRPSTLPAPVTPAMARFPEKTDLILNTSRPPNLEMPLKYLREDLTPNEAFYVRWHLGILPTRIDLPAFRLSVGGHVDKPLLLTVDALKRRFDAVSLVAVNQCSGNSRKFFDPRVAGVQWGSGAIGNARWTGVRLKDVLAKAGVKPGAVQVSFDGLDGPTIPAGPNNAGTPDYIKSLPFDRANDGEVMIAYEMNGKPLPMLNGFPLRLVVPGWYATYWVKALHEIQVLDQPFDGFWMAKAYRVPNTPNYQESPKDLAKETVPISEFTVRSLFVAPDPGETIEAGRPYEVQGLAMDSGKGIKTVEVSVDGGKTWRAAKLDPDLGRYSWRRWRYSWTPPAGRHQLMAKATNAVGQTQTTDQWNRSGYGRNVIEAVDVVAR